MDFSNHALEATTLTTPFEVQTNWHVLTGTVSSGKTTVANMLSEEGFSIASEAGRLYVEEEMAKGKTIENIRGTPALFTLKVIERMHAREALLNIDGMYFLDRAVPDGLAFCRANGVDPNRVLMKCFRHRYRSVLFFERLPVESDGVRTEDDQTAQLIDFWLVRDYTSLGYSVLRVPVLPPEQRVEFVLSSLWKKQVSKS